MKLAANMMITSDAISHTIPIVLSLLFSITYWKNGMLNATSVPILMILEKTISDIGRLSIFFILLNNDVILLVCFGT